MNKIFFFGGGMGICSKHELLRGKIHGGTILRVGTLLGGVFLWEIAMNGEVCVSLLFEKRSEIKF